MFRPHRREFLKYSAAGGLAARFAISGTKASGRVLGANDRVRIAVAGVNGRGQQHITAYGEMRDVEIGNLGTHQLDLARWAMPAGAAPQSVVSLGGRFGYQDQGQTSNTQLTLFACGDVKLLCEQRGLVGRKATKVTVEFHTSEGVVKEGEFFPRAGGMASRSRARRSAASPISGGSTSATSSTASAAASGRN